MRLYGIRTSDVAAVVWNPTTASRDEHGNPRLTGLDRDGRAIIVIVAGDDPNFVITTFPDN
jgi:hypothetical protein